MHLFVKIPNFKVLVTFISLKKYLNEWRKEKYNVN